MCAPSYLSFFFFYVYKHSDREHRKFHSIVLYKQLRNEERKPAWFGLFASVPARQPLFSLVFICEANVFSELIYLNKNDDDDDHDDDGNAAPDAAAAAIAVTVIE